MTEQKPASVTDEDWAQTPLTVQSLVTQSLKQLEQVAAQIRDAQERLARNSDATLQVGTLQTESGSLDGYLLVVDDNEMNRDMLSRRLTRQGYAVDVAIDGRQALEMIKAQKFDLILLDIMMPEMNGYEVLEYMKQDSALSQIPVIMITAVDDLDSLVRCIKLGAEDYLPKPFNPVLLKARISASLEKKRLRDQQAAYMRQLDLENQRKSNELEQARQIQLSMLPTAPPTPPHLDITAIQETASEVGGDYYDFFPLANGELIMVIGDATGHGAASGLMVSMTKTSLLATPESDLTILVNKINKILNKINLGRQLNMALLLLQITEMQDGMVTVRVCGGGMPPIYILRATGVVEEVLVAGLPLGITDEVVYGLTSFDLNSGDVLLLASDGLSERFNQARELLGYDRLATALDQIDTTELNAAEILAQVTSIGDDWAKDHPLHDDMTLVVVKVK